MAKCEKSCKTCLNAKGYSGYDDHYCEARDTFIRAEEYDCKDYKPDKERISALEERK